MWNIFKSKATSPQGGKEVSDVPEEDVERLKELRDRFMQKLRKISKQIKTSYLNANEKQLCQTFSEMMITLDGLVGIIQDLKRQYEQTHQNLIQLERIKVMLSNHHSIVNSIQENYSEQVKLVYSQKDTLEKQLKLKIENLTSQKKLFQDLNHNLKKSIEEHQQKIISLQLENKQIKEENIQLSKQKQEALFKYNRSIQGNTLPQNKKIINLDFMQLQYIFYYTRLRQKIIDFLEIKDFMQLKSTSKFYKFTLQKQESKFIAKSLRIYCCQKQNQNVKNIKYYEKACQLFSSQNIKVNALKYLYFKIKPANYILPYLQEECEIQPLRHEPQVKQQSKFSLRKIFSSKIEKKDEGTHKFSLSQLKNQEQYKKIESKIQSTFKNILQIHLPQDLTYFSQTMKRQLLELKEGLNLGGKNKIGHLEWTAQLHCLTKFMYLETSQLYNLLHVIFGELLIKNKALIQITESYEYLKQNENVLRNLIEDISYDKANLQKRYMFIESDTLKRNLEKEVVLNNNEQLLKQNGALLYKYETLLQDYVQAKKILEKYQEDRKYFQLSFVKIREEIQNLEHASSKTRRDSVSNIETLQVQKDSHKTGSQL